MEQSKIIDTLETYHTLLPAPAREVLGRGEVEDANLKQNTNPETHEINTNEKGCTPRLLMKMQLQIQDQKLQV